ncbi:MAG: hypothetical protein HY070_10695 [Chloroflexi bacterium]|nr:hypothetical protein [Chloroflexota bacterium]
MATTANELKRLQREVAALKKKVARLERKENGGERVTRTPARGLSERTRVREILRDAGMTRDLTPTEKQLAAEWRALPAERKNHVIQKLQIVRFNPPISESILQDRE